MLMSPPPLSAEQEEVLGGLVGRSEEEGEKEDAGQALREEAEESGEPLIACNELGQHTARPELKCIHVLQLLQPLALFLFSGLLRNSTTVHFT